MDVLTTILTCSLYLADDDLVRAIATSTSESNPYFVIDTSVDWTQVDPPSTPKSTAEAVARVSDILSKGGRPLLGLLEVPPRWMSAFGQGLGAAFDPCTNVAVGTAMLSEFDFECSSESTKRTARSRATAAAPGQSGARSAARRLCVLGKYEASIGSPDFAMTTTLELRSQRTAQPSVEASPIFAPAHEPRWGPDELFVFPSPSLPIAQPSDP
jgi:hypothetical protein